MVLHCKIQIVVCAILAVTSSSVVIGGQPKEQATAKPVAKVETKKAAVAETKGVAAPKAAVAASKSVAASSNKAKPQSEVETLEALGKGLQTIQGLRGLFTKDKSQSLQDGAEKFANGALSEELSKKDSQVWSTIENMIGATQKAMTSIKGKSKEEREKVMKSLEGDLNNKATVLSNVNNDVTKKQEQQDEEYLLGLLLLHKDNWSMEKQLNATKTFMHNSPILRNLFDHHDASKPLAPQLAAMLDAKPKDGVKTESKAAPAVAKAAPAVAKKSGEKKHLGKAASAAAKTLFIQLADSVMNRDCPYCAAQCVDKCHQAGKPYVQCMTDCADAGKA